MTMCIVIWVGEGVATDIIKDCNLGWGGSCNGYYKSEIFNTNEGAVDLPKSSSTSGTEYDYEYNLKIVPNIRPNK